MRPKNRSRNSIDLVVERNIPSSCKEKNHESRVEDYRNLLVSQTTLPRGDRHCREEIDIAARRSTLPQGDRGPFVPHLSTPFTKTSSKRSEYHSKVQKALPRGGGDTITWAQYRTIGAWAVRRAREAWAAPASERVACSYPRSRLAVRIALEAIAPAVRTTYPTPMSCEQDDSHRDSHIQRTRGVSTHRPSCKMRSHYCE